MTNLIAGLALPLTFGGMALINYLIPLWAAVIGILFVDEALAPSHLYALALILGVTIASRGGPRRSSAWVQRSCRVSP